MLLLMNQTEPDNSGVVGSVGNRKVGGGVGVIVLQSQTAGLLAGRKARRSLGV